MEQSGEEEGEGGRGEGGEGEGGGRDESSVGVVWRYLAHVMYNSSNLILKVKGLCGCGQSHDSHMTFM